jgi:WD40 repeat protein/predicted Ser/Thr protein kinase
MNDGATSRIATCLRCGGLLADGELAGRCPRCLAISLGLAADPADQLTSAPGTLDHLGDYELLEEVGRGGMGVVFRARQIKLDREVALKVIRDSALASSADVDRFRDEAAAAARLAHPHIVRVHDIGEAEKRPYFAMEFIAGRHLGEITRHGPLSARVAAELIAKLAGAIQHAHERGVLHRDLKPSNVLVDAAGEPHITDFGLAKRFDPASVGSCHAPLTLTGQVLGTPAYMAPEQAAARRGEFGPAIDVYSLGALLYHLVTGHAPFTGESITEVLRQVSEKDPLSPQLVNPALPADLATICLKCLAKEPVRRYATAQEVADDLHRFLRDEPIRARPASPAERAWRWCRRQPALAGSLAFGAVVLLAGLVTTTWQWRSARNAANARQEQLWESQRLEARARRTSGEPGQRIESLSVITRAAGYRPSSNLRAEAVAALALTDLRELPTWHLPQSELSETLVPPKYAVAPDDGRVAMWWRLGPSHHVVKVFAADTNQAPLVLDEEGRSGDELLFSPDGRWLAVAYYQEREVAVWDTTRAVVRWRQSVPRAADFNLDFSADGRHLAVCSTNSVVRLFDLESGTELPALLLPAERRLLRARFSPRHDRLAVAAGNVLTVWDWKSGRVLARETFEVDLSSSLAWHPDGERVAVTCFMEPEIYVCRIERSAGTTNAPLRETNRPRRVLRDPGGPVFQLAFNPEGTLLAARGRDSFTRLWDVAAERVVLRTSRGLSSGFSRDGSRLYFDRETAGVGAWEVVTNGGVYRTLRGGGPAGYLGDADFSADGRRLAWGQVGATALADLDSGFVRGLGREGSSAVRFDVRDGSLLAAGEDGLIRWRGLANNALIGGTPFQGLAQTPDGRLLAAIADTDVWLFDGTTRRLPLPEQTPARSVALSPDGRWVAMGSFWDVGYVLETGSGATVHSFNGHRASVTFDPRGRWLAAGTAQEYRLWSVDGWKELRRWPRESASAQYAPLAVNPEGALLAVTLTPRVISLLVADSGEELARLEAPSLLFVSALTFSHDGLQLAASSENGVMQVWNLARLREELRRLGLDWNEPTIR